MVLVLEDVGWLYIGRLMKQLLLFAGALAKIISNSLTSSVSYNKSVFLLAISGQPLSIDFLLGPQPLFIMDLRYFYLRGDW